jgi:hypothetical protein
VNKRQQEEEKSILESTNEAQVCLHNNVGVENSQGCKEQENVRYELCFSVLFGF